MVVENEEKTTKFYDLALEWQAAMGLLNIILEE